MGRSGFSAASRAVATNDFPMFLDGDGAHDRHRAMSCSVDSTTMFIMPAICPFSSKTGEQALAISQAIVSQTLRSSSQSTKEAGEIINGQLMALAQDLLLREAPVHSLIETIVGHHQRQIYHARGTPGQGFVDQWPNVFLYVRPQRVCRLTKRAIFPRPEHRLVGVVMKIDEFRPPPQTDRLLRIQDQPKRGHQRPRAKVRRSETGH